jgi:hypothetical protein
MCCSISPIRKEELEQALMVRPGDHILDRSNKFLGSMFETCGPIIEMQGEFIVFVHYTVKELVSPYLYFRNVINHCNSGSSSIGKVKTSSEKGQPIDTLQRFACLT